METGQPLTQLLERVKDGDRGAAEDLFQRVHTELRALAGGMMQGTQTTLQPTAVVNEAWLKLGGGEGVDWQGRGHFFGVAAKAMRSVLVDHARARATLKRGQGARRVELDAVLLSYEERAGDLLALDVVLERLERMDPRLARIVELRFFAGLSIEETAKSLEISHATVERGWRAARSWLRVELDKLAEDDGSG